MGEGLNMSLAYNDTTNKDGILQRIEQELGFTDGYITGDSTRLKQWTGSVNLALDKAIRIILKAGGVWQFDDSNHNDYPIIFTNLIANQRDYPFTSDENSNLILEIYRVMARTSTTSPYYDLEPVDMQNDPEYAVSELNDGIITNTANPSKYDKTATGVFLNTFPPSNVTNGLKIYINREGSYFTTSDTTKMPGFAGLYHEYLVLEPAYRYARANRLENQETLKRDLLEMEKQIAEFYSRRDRHVRPVMRPKKIGYI